MTVYFRICILDLVDGYYLKMADHNDVIHYHNDLHLDHVHHLGFFFLRHLSVVGHLGPADHFGLDDHPGSVDHPVVDNTITFIPNAWL